MRRSGLVSERWATRAVGGDQVQVVEFVPDPSCQVSAVAFSTTLTSSRAHRVRRQLAGRAQRALRHQRQDHPLGHLPPSGQVTATGRVTGPRCPSAPKGPAFSLTDLPGLVAKHGKAAQRGGRGQEEPSLCSPTELAYRSVATTVPVPG